MTTQVVKERQNSLPTKGHYSQQVKSRFNASEEVDDFLAGMAKDIKHIIIKARQQDPKANKRIQNPEVHYNPDTRLNCKATQMTRPETTTLISYRNNSGFAEG